MHTPECEEHCSGLWSKDLRRQHGPVPRPEGVSLTMEWEPLPWGGRKAEALQLPGGWGGRRGRGLSMRGLPGAVPRCALVALSAGVQRSDSQQGISCRASLVVQWVRVIRLLMQGTIVRSQAWEGPIRHKVTSPRALEPGFHNKGSHRTVKPDRDNWRECARSTRDASQPEINKTTFQNGYSPLNQGKTSPNVQKIDH